MKIEIEYTDKDLELVDNVTKDYRKWISATPMALSVLYDLDLMPEQIKLPINALRMATICDLIKALDDKDKTPDQPS